MAWRGRCPQLPGSLPRSVFPFANGAESESPTESEVTTLSQVPLVPSFQVLPFSPRRCCLCQDGSNFLYWFRSSSGWPVLHSPAVAPNMSMLLSIRKKWSFHCCLIVRPSTTFSPFFQLQVAERFQCLLSRPRMSCLKIEALFFTSIFKMNCQYDEDIFLRPSPRFSKSDQTVFDFHLSWFPFGTAQLTIAPTIHNRQSHLPHHEFHQGQKRPPTYARRLQRRAPRLLGDVT